MFKENDVIQSVHHLQLSEFAELRWNSAVELIRVKGSTQASVSERKGTQRKGEKRRK